MAINIKSNKRKRIIAINESYKICPTCNGTFWGYRATRYCGGVCRAARIRPEQLTTNFSVNLPHRVYDDFKVRCRQENKSLTHMVENLVVDYLKRCEAVQLEKLDRLLDLITDDEDSSV